MIALATLILLLLPFSNAQCSDLVLPWSSYTATYDKKSQICTYSNVRFAGPPTGQFRFKAPQEPSSSNPPAPSEPVSCLQVDTSQKCTPSGDLFLKNPNCPRQPIGLQVEDCLFLDIYVPLSVLKESQKVPVVVWFYGGAYVFGSKHEFDMTQIPLYSGVGVLTATPEPLIFVVGNYRLGALGWLAGSYMEQNALPNAGLYDQRKILQFVQSHIDKVNGDNTAVSAWGESAGASSILHHLVSADGKQDPLFRRAILQSPAFEWQWDRTGKLNDTYTQFATIANCSDGDITCLQDVSEDDMRNCNQKLFQSTTACTGIFPVGPSMDSQLIKTIPAAAFQTGRYWTNLTSLIVSHVSDEVKYNGSFIPEPIRNDPTAANFDKFLTAFMPGDELTAIRDQINAKYSVDKFHDQLDRVGILIRDISFTCNTRQLFDAYSSKMPVWMMNYHFLAKYDAAVHASDLLPTFCNDQLDVADILHKCLGVCNPLAQFLGHYIRTSFAPEYQSYLKSHAIHNDPNKAASGLAKKVHWNQAEVSADKNYVMHSMQPYYPNIPYSLFKEPPFEILELDPNNTAASCEFWNGVATKIMDVVASRELGPSLSIQEPEDFSRVDLRH